MLLNRYTTTTLVVAGELVDLVAVARRLEGDTTVALQDAEIDEAVCWALRDRSTVQAAKLLDLDRRLVTAHRDRCPMHAGTDSGDAIGGQL